jgi:hypothetical protein
LFYFIRLAKLNERLLEFLFKKNLTCFQSGLINQNEPNIPERKERN